MLHFKMTSCWLLWSVVLAGVQGPSIGYTYCSQQRCDMLRHAVEEYVKCLKAVE